MGRFVLSFIHKYVLVLRKGCRFAQKIKMTGNHGTNTLLRDFGVAGAASTCKCACDVWVRAERVPHHKEALTGHHQNICSHNPYCESSFILAKGKIALLRTVTNSAVASLLQR